MTEGRTAPRGAMRWAQLALGVAAMMAISSPQYVWALFVQPMRAELAVPLSALQVTIAIFSICQCGLGPLHGWLAQRFSAPAFAAAGGLLVGLSWVSSAFVDNLLLLYVTYGVLSGIGTGMIYVVVLELMSKWFPDRRGFAIGMAAGSYGFGAILTTFPIQGAIQQSGYRDALLVYGIVIGAVCVLAALGFRRPQPAAAPAAEAPAADGYTPRQMLATPIFWLMFAMMSMIGAGGLMVITQVGAFAADFGITAEVTVFGLAALPLALTVDRAANGVTRPFFGWVSDHIGRENTMVIAFTLEGLAILALLRFGTDPLAFVLLTGLVFFGWGEIFSLFPSLQADLFGPRHAANNFGFLLIATAVGSVFGGPLAALLYEQTGSWSAVFGIVAAMDFLTAALAWFALKPMRKRWKAAS